MHCNFKNMAIVQQLFSFVLKVKNIQNHCCIYFLLTWAFNFFLHIQTISDGDQKHDLESAQRAAPPPPPPPAKYRKAEKDDLARAHQVSNQSLLLTTSKYENRSNITFLYKPFVVKDFESLASCSLQRLIILSSKSLC